MTQKGLVYDVISFSVLLYVSKEGYEALQWQWVSLITAWCLMMHAERVPKIPYFVCTLRVNLSGYSIV